MNYQHLHYQFPAKPFQQWHVIEDRSVPRGLRFRHARQPGEKPDPKVNFGMEELSARLEHAGVEYIRVAFGNDAESFNLAHVLLTCGMEGEGPDYEKWYPAIPWVRDDGFYAVCLREQMPYRDACRLFGFDIPTGKPSVPKRIKRDVARGRTSLFGELLETQELNQWDLDALFQRRPSVRHYDDDYVACMIYDAKRGQTGIGYVVNAITWFNLLWLHRESIVAELRAMPPNPQVADAIRWMEQELRTSRMPMVAARLEEIIDAIKLNRSSIDWASGVITEFRETCPVAPKFWWQGGYQGQGRIPRDRIEHGNEPFQLPPPWTLPGSSGLNSSRRHVRSESSSPCFWGQSVSVR